MSSTSNNQRVARLRQSRRERGLTETNVWVPQEVKAAIDRAVAAGEFPSRRQAIIYALESAFSTKEITTT